MAVDVYVDNLIDCTSAVHHIVISGRSVPWTADKSYQT